MPNDRARAPEGATNKRRRRTTYLQPAAALLRAVNVIFHGLGTGFDVFVLEGFEDVAVFFENGLQVIIFVDRFCAFVLEKVLVRGQQLAEHPVVGRFVDDLVETGIDGRCLSAACRIP